MHAVHVARQHREQRKVLNDTETIAMKVVSPLFSEKNVNFDFPVFVFSFFSFAKFVNAEKCLQSLSINDLKYVVDSFINSVRIINVVQADRIRLKFCLTHLFNGKIIAIGNFLVQLFDTGKARYKSSWASMSQLTVEYKLWLK